MTRWLFPAFGLAVASFAFAAAWTGAPRADVALAIGVCVIICVIGCLRSAA